MPRPPLTTIDPVYAAFVEAGTATFQQLSSTERLQFGKSETLINSALIALRDQVLQVDAQIQRVTRDQAAQRARIEKTGADREIVEGILTATEELRQRGSISELDYRTRLRELRSLEGETVIFERQFDGMAAEVGVLSKQRAALISSTRSSYEKQLNEAQIAILPT